MCLGSTPDGSISFDNHRLFLHSLRSTSSRRHRLLAHHHTSHAFSKRELDADWHLGFAFWNQVLIKYFLVLDLCE
jgi:hypothetical protein